MVFGSMQGTSPAKHVRSAQTARPGTDDDNVGLGVSVEIIEVTTGHGTGYLRLADWGKCETLLPLGGHLLEALGLLLD